MNRQETNRFQMYKSVEEFLKANDNTVKEIPGFDISFTEFQNIVTDISKKDNEYQIIAEGSTAEKDTAEDEMIDELVKLCSLVYVFARRTKNEQLKVISKVTQSSLKYMRDADLLQRAKAIFEELTKNQTEMQPYGVTQENIDILKSKIESYEAKSNVKENKFAEKKNARTTLGQRFADANEILVEEMDTLVEYIKEAHTDFYGKYKAARAINDL